ncbi:3-keto-disaccharide hydrolase [Pontibacter sp. CAU 1760]
MGTKLLLVITLLFTLALNPAQEPDLKKIFNGKNLKGWVEPENNIWWRAGNGVLSAKSGPAKKGSILWTEKEYRNFTVQADFKMGAGTVDSGIFLRNENEQIQIGISGSLKRDMTGSPYIPGKGYPVEAAGVENLLRRDDWNTMRIQAQGKEYVVWLNGQEVLTYTSEDVPTKGPIGLQLHPGNEMSIDFRNIMVAEL